MNRWALKVTRYVAHDDAEAEGNADNALLDVLSWYVDSDYADDEVIDRVTNHLEIIREDS